MEQINLTQKSFIRQKIIELAVWLRCLDAAIIENSDDLIKNEDKTIILDCFCDLTKEGKFRAFCTFYCDPIKKEKAIKNIEITQWIDNKENFKHTLICPYCGEEHKYNHDNIYLFFLKR